MSAKKQVVDLAGNGKMKCGIRRSVPRWTQEQAHNQLRAPSLLGTCYPEKSVCLAPPLMHCSALHTDFQGRAVELVTESDLEIFAHWARDGEGEVPNVDIDL